MQAVHLIILFLYIIFRIFIYMRYEQYLVYLQDSELYSNIEN